ncbi:MAG: peptide chain release factor N(5)-glutamine methyltransferase [Gemmatimonadota bacterium]
MPESTLTLQGLLESATELLAAAGVQEPRRTAIRLWSDLGRSSTAATILSRGDPVSSDRAVAFLAASGRVASGEPLAYVTGWTGFRRLILATDRRALIPRPETEGIIELALGRVRHGTAADVGTGTGALALALADEGAFDRVIGTDLSPEALELARANGAQLGLAVEWLAGDLLAPLAGETVDLLVSNPPYLTEQEYHELDRSVRDFEPRLALPSGPDGLEATTRLLDEGRAVVRPDGWMVLELDCRRAHASAALAERFGWRDVTLRDDLYGRARYLLARQGAKQ